MHDEAAFLARIRETPDDVAPRLVYADWLDEHDDSRGELIRLTEEMRTLAPYSDAYWTLKPRRRELVRGVPDEWLEAMRYNDVRPTMTHGIPRDWKGRWRLLREIVERWHSIEMPDVDAGHPILAELEHSIGRALPVSVREWIAFEYRFQDNDSRDNFYDLPRFIPPVSALSLTRYPAGARLVELCVRDDHFLHADPPMFSCSRVGNTGEMTFVLHDSPYSDSVSAFAFERLWQFTDCESGSLDMEVAQATELCHKLLSQCRVRCWFNGANIFENDNLLIYLGPIDGDTARLWAMAAHPIDREITLTLKKHATSIAQATGYFEIISSQIETELAS